MNPIARLALGVGLVGWAIAAAMAPGCTRSTPTPFNEDGGGGATTATSTLTITFAGTGSGTVALLADATSAAAADGGASCSATCSRQYPTTTTVNLTATAADDSVFDGWTPDACGNALSMASSVTCTATFKQLAALPDGGDDGGGG